MSGRGHQEPTGVRGMTQRRILKKSKIEYVSHCANYCDGCAHGCLYPCYARLMKRISCHEWRHNPQAVFNAADLLQSELQRLRKPPTEILVSSSHDPYQPQNSLPTRQILEVLAEAEMPVWVLTKGGLRAIHDLDLLQRPRAKFGVSITTLNEGMRERWEPGAASIHNRFLALTNARLRDVETWVSIEPALPGLDLFRLAEMLQGLADWVVIGKWNHNRQAEIVNWSRVRDEAQEAFEAMGIPFLIKKELLDAT